MFANYNLIAALAAFLLPLLANILVEIHALYCISMRWAWSYIHLFHTRTNSFTMEWLPMIGVGIAWASFLFPMRCYPVHYLLTKWAIT
jgi:maltose/moltooligosaccharide transporter